MPQPQPGEDLAMMEQPEYWPLWPVLPLVNRQDRQSGGFPKTGVLMESTKGGYYFIPGARVYDVLKKDDPRIEVITKSDLQEKVLDKGWEVD